MHGQQNVKKKKIEEIVFTLGRVLTFSSPNCSNVTFTCRRT